MDVYILLLPPFQVVAGAAYANFQAIAIPPNGSAMEVNVQLRVVAGITQDAERTAVLNAVNAEALRKYGGTIPVGAAIRWFGI